MVADASVFFVLWLQRPLQIAAINPSNDRLADAVAQVDLTRPRPLLELGAGTAQIWCYRDPRHAPASGAAI